MAKTTTANGTVRKTSSKKKKTSEDTITTPNRWINETPSTIVKIQKPRKTDEEKRVSNLAILERFNATSSCPRPSTNIVRPAKASMMPMSAALDKDIHDLSILIATTEEEDVKKQLVASLSQLLNTKTSMLTKQTDHCIQVEQTKFQTFNKIIEDKAAKAKGSELIALVSVMGNALNGMGSDYKGMGSGTSGVYQVNCQVSSMPFDLDELNNDADPAVLSITPEVKPEPIKPVRNSLDAVMFADIDESLM